MKVKFFRTLILVLFTFGGLDVYSQELASSTAVDKEESSSVALQDTQKLEKARSEKDVFEKKLEEYIGIARPKISEIKKAKKELEELKKPLPSMATESLKEQREKEISEKDQEVKQKEESLKKLGIGDSIDNLKKEIAKRDGIIKEESAKSTQEELDKAAKLKEAEDEKVRIENQKKAEAEAEKIAKQQKEDADKKEQKEKLMQLAQMLGVGRSSNSAVKSDSHSSSKIEGLKQFAGTLCDYNDSLTMEEVKSPLVNKVEMIKKIVSDIDPGALDDDEKKILAAVSEKVDGIGAGEVDFAEPEFDEETGKLIVQVTYPPFFPQACIDKMKFERHLDGENMANDIFLSVTYNGEEMSCASEGKVFPDATIKTFEIEGFNPTQESNVFIGVPKNKKSPEHKISNRGNKCFSYAKLKSSWSDNNAESVRLSNELASKEDCLECQIDIMNSAIELGHPDLVNITDIIKAVSKKKGKLEKEELKKSIVFLREQYYSIIDKKEATKNELKEAEKARKEILRLSDLLEKEIGLEIREVGETLKELDDTDKESISDAAYEMEELYEELSEHVMRNYVAEIQRIEKKKTKDMTTSEKSVVKKYKKKLRLYSTSGGKYLRDSHLKKIAGVGLKESALALRDTDLRFTALGKSSKINEKYIESAVGKKLREDEVKVNALAMDYAVKHEGFQVSGTYEKKYQSYGSQMQSVSSGLQQEYAKMQSNCSTAAWGVNNSYACQKAKSNWSTTQQRYLARYNALLAQQQSAYSAYSYYKGQESTYLTNMQNNNAQVGSDPFATSLMDPFQTQSFSAGSNVSFDGNYGNNFNNTFTQPVMNSMNYQQSYR